ncbi:MAG: NUDIX domain-containing protein [Thermomicrobiales bacterium]|nr:NUDIX domain-containing protein [Thermomicrobiales bacterium]
MKTTPADQGLDPIIRPGVRVLLIDDTERVLLFAGTDEAGGRFWFPPGGGSEPGESAEETAQREIHEETGLTNLVIEGELGRRQAVVSWGGVSYDCRERWFVARVAPFGIDTSGFTAEERTSIHDHHWWKLAELEQATERLVPARLTEIMRRLLRDGMPSEPCDIGR